MLGSRARERVRDIGASHPEGVAMGEVGFELGLGNILRAKWLSEKREERELLMLFNVSTVFSLP